MAKFVVLDASGLPPGFDFKIPGGEHKWVVHQQTTASQAADRLADADIAILSKTPISEQTLKACPRLKHIAVVASGFNIVDVDACTERGVSVSNVPSYAATSVAEHTIACTLILRRRILDSRQAVIAGDWSTANGFCLFGQPFNNLADATMGIVGMGEIGSKTASLAHALGMQVVFSARSKTDHWAQQVDLDSLLETSDIVSLHCNLNDSNQKLINTERLQRMAPHAILINTARGGLIDEVALAEALNNKQIGGIALDVLAQEPPKNEPPEEVSPLLALADQPNVIITPHNSWTSQDSVRQMQRILQENLQGFLSGKPANLVNI